MLLMFSCAISAGLLGFGDSNINLARSKNKEIAKSNKKLKAYTKAPKMKFPLDIKHAEIESFSIPTPSYGASETNEYQPYPYDDEAGMVEEELRRLKLNRIKHLHKIIEAGRRSELDAVLDGYTSIAEQSRIAVRKAEKELEALLREDLKSRRVLPPQVASAVTRPKQHVEGWEGE